MHNIKINKKRLIILLILIIIFIFISTNVFILKTTYIDNIYIPRTDTLSIIFKIITKLGEWYTLIFITLISLLLKDKKYFKYMSINLISVTLLSQILKNIIRRSRPLKGLIKAIGYSFPSGHSMVSLAYYGFIFYLLEKSNIKYKRLYQVILILIIISIAVSRIILNVHYVTDVIGGLTLGLIYLIIYLTILEEKNERCKRSTK